MNIPFQELVSYDNLIWAWEKVRTYYRSVDTWCDEIRLHAFESRLQRELHSISRDLAHERYSTRPIRPLPQPKRAKPDGTQQIRQAFWIDVRDQVATIAYVNVVGGELDRQMPTWSYGNRLHRSLRVVESGAQARANIGPYRNSSAQIYRRFAQSWPLYKRHIVLSLRKMCGRGEELADDAERFVLDREALISDEFRLPYLRQEYWKSFTDVPVWASLDIERFYPSLAIKLIREQLLKHSEAAREIGSKTLNSLTRFHLDSSEWSRSDLEKLGVARAKGVQSRLPTGLMVAGFFANVALLELDSWVSHQIQDRQIAHFRYVDDHVVLAKDVDSLINWLRAYAGQLESLTRCKANHDKYEPAGLGEYLKSSSSKRLTSIRPRLELDPEFPIPLMTTTLAKVSDIAKTNFDLLPQGGQRKLLDDLEHLLLAPLPETEMAEKTRVTFAATRLARFTPRHERAADEYLAAWRQVLELDHEVRSLDQSLKALRADVKEAIRIRALRVKRRREQRLAIRRFNTEEDNLETARTGELQRILKVLMRALRQQEDKLRLWEKVLDFARFSGVNHVEPVVGAIADIAEKNPLAAALIRARILQVHSRNMLVCAQTAISSSFTNESRDAAIRYLHDLFDRRHFRLLKALKGPRYYEQRSLDLFLAASSLCCEIITTSADPSDPRLRRLWKSLRSLAERVKPTRRSDEDGYLWWREKTLYSLRLKLSSSGTLTHKLNPDDPASWLIWECRPELIPLSALGAVLSGKIKLDRGAEGWFRDIIATRAKTSRRQLLRALNPRRQSRANTVLRSVKRSTTLFEWAGWTRELQDQFDPRGTEWTVLRIARQICSLLRNEKISLRRRLKIASHPANFHVPRPWWDSSSKYGWREWSELSNRNSIEIRSSIIPDTRVAAALGIFVDLPTEFALVRAIGALIFGLLRRDFLWPMPWRVIGLQATLRVNIQEYLEGRPCSSRTLAILEATLLARSYESWLLIRQGVDQASLADDVAEDPPNIVSLLDLDTAIEKTMNTLEKYQLTVTEFQPRQLVPLRVAQYTRSNWAKDDEEEGDGGA